MSKLFQPDDYDLNVKVEEIHSEEVKRAAQEKDPKPIKSTYKGPRGTINPSENDVGKAWPSS